ncbi:hypothetical protein D3P08_15045 [Paenibacillus nanensis]|uniref:Uncharacterized protein n=1 Tax=Paenibacillus nanensis TaxID=393251 RepID=A0A3A1UVF8_9BACL|nr:hypothetical protein [Paenibacillus nanensis]RIX51736.1 hypothetical protein D3P08_15045 [Paenibacillus nanensis]
MAQTSLVDLLRPVRRRLTMFRLARALLLGLTAGSGAGALVLAAARLWPILNAAGVFAGLVAAGAAAGAGYGIWKRATTRDAAREMDKRDTEDAVMTALDGLAKYPEAASAPAIVKLQRQDALDAARGYVDMLSERLPWPAWKQWRTIVFSAAALLAICIVMLALPNPQHDRAVALAEARSAVQELEAEAEKLEEELDSLKLPEEAKEELLRPLDELRRELNASGVDPAAALEELAEAMRELEQTAAEAKAASERLEQTAAAMSAQPSLRQLGAALQDRDAAAMERAIEDMRSQLKELSPAEREALAQALERLAAEQPQEEGAAGELAAALEEAAQQARAAGDDGAAEGEAAPESGSGGDALAALQEALAREMSQGELERLAREMSGQLAGGGAALAEQLAAQGGAVPPSWAGAAASGAAGQGSAGSGGQSPGSGSGQAGEGAGQSGGSGSGAGAGQGQGAGSGAGQGSGSGVGSGSGGSGGGSGAGSGSGTGSSGSGTGSGSGAGGGYGAGTGAGSRTLVTTPRSLAGSGDVYEDGGPSTGGQTQSGGQSPMIDGTTRPYEEVYSEYAAEAQESLGRSQLPASMQDKVKQYFDEIQPNR